MTILKQNISVNKAHVCWVEKFYQRDFISNNRPSQEPCFGLYVSLINGSNEKVYFKNEEDLNIVFISLI